MYSVDITRPYRWLPTDPLDWPLKGFTFLGKFWFDQSVQFGSRKGTLHCQLVKSLVAVFMHEATGAIMYVYLDDFAGADKDVNSVLSTHHSLTTLLTSLGLAVNASFLAGFNCLHVL